MALPASVLAKVEMSPVEDLLLALLRDELPDVPIKTLISKDPQLPFVLVRGTGAWGEWDGDPRFLDASSVSIQVFVEGLNADEDAALLSEAIRVVLRDSINKVVPNRGHLVSARMMDRAKRASDWATSTGPVQYADLPAGTTRFESTFAVVIRKPANKPFPA